MAEDRTLPAGSANVSGLAPWAQDYITNYLGKAQALGNMPMQVYQGPLTAGPSQLQNQAFSGIGSLTVPGSVSQAAQTAGDVAAAAGNLNYTPTAFSSTYQGPRDYTAQGGSFTEQGMAQKYMNPMLEQTLQPQLQALQRQADINRQMAGASAAKQGAFGGSRAGLMNAQTNADLMRQQQQTTGSAYQKAFEDAQSQFNAEQARKIQEAQFGSQQEAQKAQLAAQYGLSAQQAAEQSKQFGAQYGLQGLAQKLAASQAQGNLGLSELGARQNILNQMMQAGGTQRDISQQGISADYNEFLRQQRHPYEQLQFQREMIGGLPVGSVQNQPAQLSGVASLISALGGAGNLATSLNNPNIQNLFKGLGINF